MFLKQYFDATLGQKFAWKLLEHLNATSYRYSFGELASTPTKVVPASRPGHKHMLLKVYQYVAR